MYQSIQMNSKFMLRVFRAARNRNLENVTSEEITAVVANSQCALCYHREMDIESTPCWGCVNGYRKEFFTPITAPVVILKES